MLPETRQRAKDAITEIVGLPRHERIRALEAQFPDDTAFREEILSLLDVYDAVAAQSLRNSAAHDLLDYLHGQGSEPTTTSAGGNHGPAAPGAATDLLKIGNDYGPYRVRKAIGAGGMGQVFLAEDLRLGRHVALKSLAGKWLDSPNARRRLMREARAVAALVHPNIAALYDVVEQEDCLLLVMEYVEGKTLASLIKDGPIPLGHALRLAIQVADAISYAHDHGVIHCDLKPANIQASSERTAKVLDFGLARIRYTGDESAERSVTTTGVHLGTPGYVAPERLLRGVLNASGDIYSLGVVLFEMVTGRRLLEGPDPERVFDILSAGPPKASSIVNAVPVALDDVIERALSIDPAFRYQSARELGRDLQVILRSLETQSSGPLPSDAGEHRSTSSGPRLSTAAAAAESPTGTPSGLSTLQLFGTVLFVVTFTGFVTSTAYDFGLARTAEFGAESPLLWPVWGFRALLSPAVLAALGAIVFAVSMSVARALFAMIAPLKRPLNTVRLRYLKSRQRFESAPIATLAHGLLIVHVVTFAALWWRFQPMIAALIGFILSRPSTNLSVFGGDYLAEHRLYRQLFSVELVLFAAAWFQLLKMRARRGHRDAAAPFTGGLALTALTMLLAALPYRIFSKSGGESVVYGNQQCSLVGQRGDDGLLFCPQQHPPWNRIVRLDDVDLHRAGTQESIFAHVTTASKEHR